MEKRKAIGNIVIIAFIVVPSLWLINHIVGYFEVTVGSGFYEVVVGFADSFRVHPYPYVTALSVGLTFAVILLLIAIIVSQKIDSRNNAYKGIEHGSSRWATKGELKKYSDQQDFSNNVILADGVYKRYQGQFSDRSLNKNNNIALFAGSGAGKSYWMGLQIMQAESSYFLSDPKGETIEKLGKFLESQGYQIKIVNTANPALSVNRYNPFAYVHSEDDQLKFVEMLISVTNEGSSNRDIFWENSERMLLSAYVALMFEMIDKEERTMGTLCTLHRQAEAKEENEDYVSVLDEMFEMLREDIDERILTGELPKEYESYALTQYENFKKGAGKTLQSIIVSVSVRLARFNLPAIKQMLSADDLDIEKMGSEKVFIGAIIDDYDKTFSFIATMLEYQIINTLLRVAEEEHGGTLPIPVQLLLDEVRNIGKIPNLDIAIAVVRSRNISIILALQSVAQLKDVYGEQAAETILDCCGVVLYLGGGRSKVTTETISAYAGMATIETSSISTEKGSTKNPGISYSDKGRELLNSDEVFRLQTGWVVVSLAGVFPYRGKQFDISKHPNYKKTGYASKDLYPIYARGIRGVA